MEEKKTTTIAGKSAKRSNNFLRDQESKPVTGVFHFNELPGGTLDFFFKKWKGDPIERYKLKDGEGYNARRYKIIVTILYMHQMFI